MDWSRLEVAKADGKIVHMSLGMLDDRLLRFLGFLASFGRWRRRVGAFQSSVKFDVDDTT